MPTYLSSADAAAVLGVSRQTLYAYVSRGLLHAHAGDDPRESRYLADDVQRLASNRARGRKPKEAARTALDWGLPVLASSLTLIEDGRLYYRGHDAAALARTASVEEVAALLWGCTPQAAFAPQAPELPPDFAQWQHQYAQRRPETTLLPLFALAGADDVGTQWQWQDKLRMASCGALVRRLAACLLGSAPSAAPLHAQCASAWGLDAEGADLVRAALVLCADHELNASGFTARCVASTGASLQAALVGGLAALSGPRHGGTTARVEVLLDETLSAASVEEAIGARLARGEALPGFGHHLYPDGDIRAAVLLETLLPRYPQWQALVDQVRALTGHAPSVDFALVALRRHLDLPPGSAFGLFALGRSLGWLAHALEQHQTGSLIRPRAAYIGLPPTSGASSAAG